MARRISVTVLSLGGDEKVAADIANCSPGLQEPIDRQSPGDNADGGRQKW